jgi:hypothetical protein
VLLPSGGQAALDTATQRAYDAWKAKYLRKAACPGGGTYVFSNGGTGRDVGDEVSEGHGYGMVITAMMAGYDPEARAVFDDMYLFFKNYPSATHKNLMTWTLDVAGGCTIPPRAGNDSATDADLDIAYSLLVAEAQWPGSGYLEKAKAAIADVLSGDINAATRLPTLGDWSTASDPMYRGTRPSDFVADHWRAFGRATGDFTTWQRSIDSAYSLVAAMQKNFAPRTGFLPDFVVRTEWAPAPAPPGWLEGATDGEYGPNSCRVPWRFATDYIVSGDLRAKDAVSKLNAWIIARTGGDPAKILGGYTLSGDPGSGQPAPAAVFASPFGVAAMLSGSQAWLDGIWSTRAITGDYSSDTITLSSMLVMSGNWWLPCD